MTTVVAGNNTGDDYAGAEDTRLDSQSATFTFGTHASGYVGNSSGGRIMKDLSRYDLSSLSSGDAVTAASINLYDHNWGNRTADCTVNVYEVSAANGDWAEDALTDQAVSGAPCWNQKEYSVTDWAGSAGLATATTDYVNTSLGSKAFTDGVSGYRAIDFNSSGLSLLEDWLGDATNNGFLLVGSGSGSYWTEFTSGNGTDGQRPYLSVTYTAGGATSVAPLRRRIEARKAA